MGYYMVYGCGDEYSPKRNSFRLRVMISACMLLFSILTRTFWAPGAEKLREVILPVENNTSRRAFDVLLDDLREGASIEDSLEVFCRTVLNGEN